MSYLEELLPEFRKGAKIRLRNWPKDMYIQQKDREIKDNDGGNYYFGYNFMNYDNWEFYEEPIDWDYIIKNRCLCYFWDEKFNWAMYGTLGKIEKGGEYRFTMFDDAGNRSSYKNCRPVRTDEVTFYEDKEDEI